MLWAKEANSVAYYGDFESAKAKEKERIEEAI